ncbi:membrane dipeptidase [Ginsengibacter hankyongi]|uniref:Membrane dipeptidase n=1 Tax=Ginsengibacter hankyongi TaxID=2607284 RepID=A0A5J5IMT3_9BACT|nr:dipeptidase [Ginsengibacter hankyongi]KAA9042021.1 membrane dipeptidase [Ginsengibacter hankyongi]
MKSYLFFITFSFSMFSMHVVNAQSYKKIHRRAILVDTHNDLLTQCFEKNVRFDDNLKGKTQSDLQRFAEGGVDVQVFSIWCDGKKEHPYNYAKTQIDTLYATIQRHPGKIALVKNSTDLLKAVKQKKLAAMIGVEGGHMIENDISNLDTLYNMGVRYMTLTWNNSTPWATSAEEETDDSLLHQPKGLNDFGKEIIHHMNELGMLVDLSHVGEKTFWDAIATTSKPVLVSHSCAYTICPVFRNLKDDQIKAVGKNGGIIDINFYNAFLDSNYIKREMVFLSKHKNEKDSLLKIYPDKDKGMVFDILNTKYKDEYFNVRPPLSLIIDHIDYIVKLIGVDHVGLGSDFDGVNNSTPQQLEDITGYPQITKALLKRGYSRKDVFKILGGNFIRLLEENEESN